MLNTSFDNMKQTFIKQFRRQTQEVNNMCRKQEGFTLIELLVVIIILGLLSALVAPKFFGKVDKAKLKTAKTQIELFGSALDEFRLDNGRYPTTAEGLEALRTKPGALANWDGPYLPKQIPRGSLGPAVCVHEPRGSRAL